MIIAQLTLVLKTMELFFKYRGIKFHKIDGSTSENERNRISNEFNSEFSQSQILILSSGAGNNFIDIQSIDTVILYSNDIEMIPINLEEKKKKLIIHLLHSNFIDDFYLNCINLISKKIVGEELFGDISDIDNHLTFLSNSSFIMVSFFYYYF